MADRFITPRNLEKFESLLTDFHTVKIEDAGHFPQEEKSGIVVEEIRRWLG